jgi:autotransporter-associated beta strand protein
LQIGNGGTTGSVSGNIIDNGALNFNRSDSVIYNGVISGFGSVTQSGAGTLILTGTNTFSGLLATISAGTLQIGNGGATGSISATIIDNATLSFDRSDVFTFGNAISGSGALKQIGSGTLILTGPGTFLGGTTISSGVLQIGAGGFTGSISGNVVDNGMLVFDRSNNVTFAGSVSGTGSLNQVSAGALILTGTSNFTGGTTISAGTLQLGNGGATGSITGNVIDNGTLTFNRSDAMTFSGVIFGSGEVRQIGTGTTTLSAFNNYDGLTTVSAGTLNVTGTIGRIAVATGGTLPLPGTVNVANGGTLTGTGRVFVVNVASGGTLSPGTGGAPGTLTVQDNLVLASGANYVDAISPTVTGLTSVTGSAAVNGALAVNAAAGTYTLGQHYTLLSAAGGLSGTFSSVSTTGLNAYKTAIGYDANSVFLTLSANAITPLLPSGLGANQAAAAKGIDSAIAGGASLNSGFNALFGLSGAALGGAITQLSGQTGADAAQGATQSFSPFLALLMSQSGGGVIMTAANFAPDQGYGADGAPRPAQLEANTMRIWGSVFGTHTGIAADPVSGAQRLKAGDAGLAAGVEVALDGNLLLGASVAGGHASFSSGNGTGNSDDVMLGVYGRMDVLDRGYVAGALSYGWHTVDTLRIVTISGTDALAGNYTAHDIGGRIETGYRVALDESYGVTPYAAFVVDDFQAPAYGETALSGSAGFALSYAAHDTDFAHSELGARIGRGFALDEGMLSAEVSAAWSHELQNDPFALASFQALPGSSFVVHGIRPGTDTALLGLGVALEDGSGVAYGARFESQVGPGTTSIAGAANIAYRW